MRFVKRLSAGSMEARMRYAAEDLFMRPETLGGRVLLLDDILNTGASMLRLHRRRAQDARRLPRSPRE